MIEAAPLEGLTAVRHGFFGRTGGVSRGVYASLNAGLRTGDDPAAVAINRGRCAERLGVAADRLVSAKQVHGVAVALVDRPWPQDAPPEADALVTDRPGLALGVLTADCAPVLLADGEAGVIAAVHAGWRGALAGVIEAAITAMVALGAQPGRMRAAVGPCIGRESYEVGPELLDAFRRADPGSEALFAPAGRGDRLLFDLKACARRRIDAAGIAHVGTRPEDTCADSERFFSYRRACHRGEARFGLQISAIALG